MRNSWWQSVRALLGRKITQRLRRTTKPIVEALEDRRLMTQRVWDGGATVNDKWSNKNNWQGDVAPNPGDTLVFPAGIGALDRGTNNDFAPLTSFKDIVFRGGDFKLAGNRVLLTGNITSDPTDNIDKPNEIKLDISFSASPHTVGVDGVTLNLSGAISNEAGPGQLTYAGSAAGGKIALLGKTSNTYDQPTIVESSGDTFTVRMSKDDNVRAISGPLTATGESTVVDCRFEGDDIDRDGQLKPNLSITVASRATVFLAQETIGTLTLSGAFLSVSEFSDDPGQVTLNGSVFASGGSSIVMSVGTLRLASTASATRTIDVATGGNLDIGGPVTSGNILKTGAGVVDLVAQDGNNSFGTVTVSAGTVETRSNDGSIAIPGNVFVGDSSGLPALFKIKASSGNNAVADTATITVAATGSVVLENATETIGALTVNGGNVALKANENLQVAGDATFNGGLVKNEGGTLGLRNGLTMNAGQLETPSGRTLLAGSLTALAAATPSTINGSLELTVGSHSFSVADGATNKDLLINAAVRNQIFPTGTVASVIKTGPGKLELKGNNTYTGTTTVASGSLLVNGTNAAGQGTYLVQGGELRGVGTISNLQVGSGIVSPGDGSGGLLKVLGSTTLGTDGKYVAHLDGTSVPAFDQIRTGTLFLDHTLNPDLRPILEPKASFTAAVGQNFRLIDVTGPTPLGDDQFFRTLGGQVLTQGDTFTADNQNFTINYFGGDGNDVVITRNTGPAFANRQITPEITEGETAFIRGHITEPNHNDTFFLDVDWGDGTSLQTFTFPPGSPKDIKVGHRYLDNPRDDDHYDVKLLWRDQHGGSNSAELETIVRNKAPILGQITASLPPFTVGQPITIRSSVTDLPLDTFKVHVRWDLNGPWQAINLPAGTKFFQLKHTYAKAGDHHVTVLLIDDDLDFDQVSFLLNVS